MPRNDALVRRASAAAVLTAAATTLVAQVPTTQSLLQAHGEVIAAYGRPVPGLSGGEVFGGTACFDLPVIDENGTVLFRGRITGGSQTAVDELAYFAGKTAADLTMVVRSGDPAPGIPGAYLRTATGNGPGSNPRLSPSGSLFLGSNLDGSGVGPNTDTALFVGPPGGVVLLARQSSHASGLPGGVKFRSDFSSPLFRESAINRNGRVVFGSEVDGPSVTTANDYALFTGLPGALSVVQREGDVVLGGQVIAYATAAATERQVNQVNDAGQVLHDAYLSVTAGTPPATTADNWSLWIYTPGVGNTLVVREGASAPGTAGATFNFGSNYWVGDVSDNAFTRTGRLAFIADLMNGDVVPAVNDRAIYVGGVSGISLFARTGDAAPGVPGATFSDFVEWTHAFNASEAVLFQAKIIGPGITSNNDSGIWFGTAGALQLVAREGDPAPGTVGATFSSFVSVAMAANDQGQALFGAPLVGGDVVGGPMFNAAGLYAFDPETGLTLVVRRNDAIETAPGVVRHVNGWLLVTDHGGDGASLGFNHHGDFALRVSFSDATTAILRGHVGSLWGAPSTISTATGGMQRLYMNAGASKAGLIHYLVGSAGGTVPGFALGSFTLPLNYDFYMDYTISYPNVYPLANSAGLLDVNGRGVATFSLPTGFGILTGVTLHHAFVTLDLGLNVVGVSEPAALTLTP